MNSSDYQSTWLWPIILFVSTFSVSIVVVGHVLSPLRYALVFWFLLVCPGMAYVRLLDIQDTLARWTVAVALSLGLETAVSLVVLYSGNWSSNLVFVMMVAITLGGVALQIWRNPPNQVSQTMDERG